MYCGNPAIEKSEYVVVHALHAVAGVEEIGDFPVPAGQVPQRHVPVRIGQAAQVEDEVGIGGNAVLVAE